MRLIFTNIEYLLVVLPLYICAAFMSPLTVRAQESQFTDPKIVHEEIMRLLKGNVHNTNNVADLCEKAKIAGQLHDVLVLTALQGKYTEVSAHLAHLGTLEKILTSLTNSNEKIEAMKHMRESYRVASLFSRDVGEFTAAANQMSPNMQEYIAKHTDNFQWLMDNLILPRTAELEANL